MGSRAVVCAEQLQRLLGDHYLSPARSHLIHAAEVLLVDIAEIWKEKLGSKPRMKKASGEDRWGL